MYKYNPEKDADTNKILTINEQWEELKAASHTNIQSEKEVLNRQIHSIQTEGHFGDIKENDGFRRFNHCSKKGIQAAVHMIGQNKTEYVRIELLEVEGSCSLRQ